MQGVCNLKRNRQEMILNLIKEKVCLTQEDLQNGLMELGFNVTQSTVSRDIRELKLVKGRDDKGNYRYLVNETKPLENKENHYKDLFSRSVKSIAYALNNVVIKCNAGMASSVCVAVDEMFGDKMLGSLAGDDTIIIVTDCEEKSLELTLNLNNLL
jgi:transcriptional regulator of arginine metabolism